MRYDICIIGTKDTTISLCEYLLGKSYNIDCVITIDWKFVNTANISGFGAVEAYVRSKGIFLYKSKTYSLKDEESRDFFEKNRFGIGICIGWQRLIPEQVLSRFDVGVFGFHGSCGYLPYGRGRSPLNWSVINGDRRFILNLFKYDGKPDSPNVYMNRLFEITPYDNIRSLQYKWLLVSFDLVERLINDYKNGAVFIKYEYKDPSTFYPKRTPEDGRIYFTQKTNDIYNLIRGVTRPFPGAFAFINDEKHKIIIWGAAPFDAFLDFSEYTIGEVIAVFDNDFIIRTIDGSLLIKDYECENLINKGDKLL